MSAEIKSTYRKETETSLEIDVLIRLLNEYASRLRDRSTDLRRSIERTYYAIAFTVAGGLVFYTIVVFTILNVVSTVAEETPSYVGTIIPVFLAVCALGLFMWGIRIFGGFEARKRKLLRQEIKQSLEKLERVVRLGSQALEHVEHRRWKLLELELALTDAEGSLEGATQALEFRFSLIPSKIE